MSPEAALAACRFMQDAPAMLLWGAFGFIAFLVPADLARQVARRLVVVRVSAVLVVVVATLVALPIETAVIGDGWPDALTRASLRAVLIETNVGRAWMAQVVAALLLLATVWSAPQVREPLTAAAAGLLLATLAAHGHAVMQEGWSGAAHRLNDAGHVLAAGAWLGALVPFVLILADVARPAFRRQADTALRRFSSVGHGVVSLIVVTGIANTALTLGRWPTDWSSPYQALLAMKIGVVALMIALAVFNRYAVVPRLRRRRVAASATLRVATIGEVGLGLGAVALVAVLGLLDPS